MGDYFRHWLETGRKLSSPPRIFGVNWFNQDKNGNYMWPGFSDNMRILQWIVDRVHGRAFATESPIGWIPRFEDIDWTGCSQITASRFSELVHIDREHWKAELLSQEGFFEKLYDRLPREIQLIRELLLSALWKSPERWEFAQRPED
jgi:phosphoenolpyruvate carboxykinase (GTP)